MTRIRLAYWAAVIVLVTLYFTVPGARPLAGGLVGAIGVAAIGIGVRWMRPQRRLGWLLLAVAVALLAAGNVIFTAIAANTKGPVGYPVLPVGSFLLAYLPLAVGLFLLGRPMLRSRDSVMILDVLALSLAISLLAWRFVARPAVVSLQLTGVGMLAAIAMWVGYAAVVALAARALLGWRANPAVALVDGGVVALLTANVVVLEELTAGNWRPGGPTDLGFLAFGAVCGAAALTPSMTGVVSADPTQHRLGPLRFTMLALAMLVAPAALLVEATSGQVTTGVAIAVVSAAVGVLMLIRISLSARLYRWRLVRVQAVRDASRALLSATTEHDVVGSVRTALSSMLATGTSHGVRLVDSGLPGSGGPPTRRWPGAAPTNLERKDDPLVAQPPAVLWPRDDVPGGRSDINDLFVRLPTDTAVAEVIQQPTSGEQPGPTRGDEPPRTMVFTAPTSELLELWSPLLVLSELAGSALQRIRLVAILRADERERYFRTLVLTSTDVTLISRRGRIDYATPSSLTMFGRDVRGEVFDDLVQRQPVGSMDDELGEREWSDTVDGEDGYVFRPDGGSDVVVVHRRDLADDPTIRGVVSTLRNVTQERTLQRDLAFRASHDPLTGLANTELFGQELRSAGQHGADRRQVRASSTGRAALFVDLDDFKAINDTYGHEIGDRVLVEAARRIESCLRPEDVAARVGGDEFAVLLRDLPDVATAGNIAQRIVDALAGAATINATTTINAAALGCQGSVGLAYAPGPVEPDLLLRQADAALYAAKAHGKGEWRLYDERLAKPERR